MKNLNKFEFLFFISILLSLFTILINGCASQQPINLKLSHISYNENIKLEEVVDNAIYIKKIEILDSRENKYFLGNTNVPIWCDNIIDWSEKKFNDLINIPLNNNYKNKIDSDETGLKLTINLKKAECTCSYLNLRCSLGFEAKLLADKDIIFSEFIYGSQVREKTIMSGGYCNFNVDEINITMNETLNVIINKLNKIIQ